MITIFNRKELFRTYDEERHIKIRNQLEKHRIDFDFKVNFTKMASSLNLADGSACPSRAIIGKNVKYEYIIYVKKKDYKTACAFLK